MIEEYLSPYFTLADINSCSSMVVCDENYGRDDDDGGDIKISVSAVI